MACARGGATQSYLPGASHSTSPFCAVLVPSQIRGFCLLRCLALSPVLVAGCSKKPPPTPAPEASLAPAASAVPDVPRCAELKPGVSFLIGEPGAGAADPEAADVAFPFGVELGGAAVTSAGFAVGGLRQQSGGTGAFVALVQKDGSSGQIVDLGLTHGNVDPPRLASHQAKLLVVVPDSDAGGTRLRLATISQGGARGHVVWGAELLEPRDDSQVFDVAVCAAQGGVVWDEWDSKLLHSVVRSSTVKLSDVSQASAARTISPADNDVEAPRLVPRPQGFWLAWISHSTHADAGTRRPRPSAPRGRATPKPAGIQEPDSVEPVVDLGPRWLEIVALDAAASPLGPPQVVTKNKDSHVLVYELAAAPDGGAWLAWRDDRTTPGVEAGQVHLALVRADGTIESRVVEDEELGVGAASLLIDRTPPPQGQAMWLALSGVADATRVAALDARGHVIDRVGPESVMRGAEPLALDSGRMLMVRPRRQAAELFVVTCRAGAPGDK